MLFDMSMLSSLFKEFPALLAYVNKNATFLRPLPPDQEKECIRKMKEGDKTARDKLVEHNLRLVAHIAKKYNNCRDTEDLISIGTIGLIKAINTFNDKKGTHLATYAARCIENEILMSIRVNKKRNYEMSLNDPIGIDREGNTISLIDILGTDSDDVLDKAYTNIQIEKMKKKMDQCLNCREKFIIKNRYGFNMQPRLTQREIAKKLHISRSYVSRIEKKAISKLHCALNCE
ncbi:MAG: RNA polymerase sporulation sigma factor SigK [Halanaerobiales bacterium]|nr:RNA polymerase sporulation sigma factor SigK [Halanaerobiales bacterium]